MEYIVVQVIGKDKDQIKRVSCKNCSSVLEYVNSEKEHGRFNQDYLGDFDLLEFIRCPCCQNRVVIG